MADNLDKLDETFKKSAENFSLLPPSDDWKNVEQEIRRRDRRRRFIIFFFAGAGLFISTMLLFPDKAEHNKSASQKEKQSEKSTSLQRNDSSISQNSAAEQKNITANNTTIEQSAIDSKSREKIILENKKQGTSVLPKQENKNTIACENIRSNNTDAKILIAEQAQTTLTSTVVSEKPALQDTATSVNENDWSNNTDAKILIAEQAQTATTLTVVSPRSATQDTAHADSNAVVALPAPLPTIVPLTDTLSAAELTQPTPTGRWSVALGIAPALSFWHTKEDNNYQYVAQYRDSTDKNLLTFNVHANLAYKINPRVEIFCGLSLVNFKQEILREQVVYDYPTLSSGPTPQPIIVSRAYFHINGDSLQLLKNKYTFLEIPFGIRYTILTLRKFSIRLQPHIAFNMLIRSSGYIYDYNTGQYRKFNRQDLRGFNFSYVGGVAFQYALPFPYL